MNKRTERELQIALGKLLEKVRFQDSWNTDAFIEASKHICNISKSEAVRFRAALINLNLLQPGRDHRKLRPNFDPNIYTNQDKMNGFVKDILEMFPIVQKRGRVKGKHYSKKQELLYPTVCTSEPEVVEEIINPLEYFSSQDLVTELRNRGFTVTASRQIITIEEL